MFKWAAIIELDKISVLILGEKGYNMADFPRFFAALVKGLN
jgi:hypothetical protein